MANASASLAKDSALLAKKLSDAAEETGDTIVVQPQAHVAIAEPRTYSEAVGDPEFSRQWEAAIQEELDSLAANETWQLEELLPG